MLSGAETEMTSLTLKAIPKGHSSVRHVTLSEAKIGWSDFQKGTFLLYPRDTFFPFSAEVGIDSLITCDARAKPRLKHTYS